MSTQKHKATKQQVRDREKRRAARVEKAAETKQAQRQRNTVTAVIVVAVLALVAAVVLLSNVLGSDPAETQGAQSAPTAGSSGQDGATGAATDDTSAAAVLPENCTEPPPAPGAPAQLELPDAAGAAGTTFEAVLTTNCGEVTIELDGERSPQAVASFVELAERAFYDDSPCHRLLASTNVVLQCGDPTGTGTGGPGYGYGVEYVPEDGSYPRGTLAMARTADVESGTGSQFFIVTADSVWPPEGGGYTIFGNVTSGMEIVDQVVAAGVAGGGADGPPALPLSILSIAVTEK